MKTKLILLVALLISITSLAQVRGINYKAIVKDASGNILSNQSITLQFTIYDISEIETLVYRENHSALMTNSSGLIITNIGEGTPLAGDFSTIEWGGVQNLNVQIDIGAGFVDMGTELFKHVPYALYALDSGNKAFSRESNIIKAFSGTDSFLLGSSQLGDLGNPAEDKRLFFDRDKAAFRAGTANGDEWNNVRVGQGSFASGQNTVASGLTSTAMGYDTTALGEDSAALGTSTNANGISTTSLGRNTSATPYASVAMGRYNNSVGNTSSWISSDPLFMVGNGTSSTNKNNALTIYKNGNAEFDGEIRHTSTGAANMIPIAYGSVTETGSILSGTGNFSVGITGSSGNQNFRIAVNGKALTDSNTIVSITPKGNVLRFVTINSFTTSGVNISLFNTSGLRELAPFHFVIYQL